LSTSSFVKNCIQQAGFSEVKNESKTEMAANAGCEVGENGQIGQTVWKINSKQKDTAAVSKVKPSELKQIQIKLMVA
jgi:hypothetical protein